MDIMTKTMDVMIKVKNKDIETQIKTLLMTYIMMVILRKV